MKGAIFYASKYGSTAQYAQWIAQATGLPTFNTDEDPIDPATFDFLVLASPIIYYKLYFQRWLKGHQEAILGRPAMLVTVSGAGPGPKLDAWMTNVLHAALRGHLQPVALRGRQIPEDLTLVDRAMLLIAGLKNPDRQAAREEMQGFDYMDKASIAPIIDWVEEVRASDAEDSAPVAATRA